MIAIIAAVPLETELLRRELCPCEVRNCCGRELFRGTLFGRAASLLHCGIGKAGAAAAVASLLATERPSAVIMIGCGGAYAGSGLEVGDLALATAEIYGDEGALTTTGFLDMEELGLPLLHKPGLTLYNRFPVSTRLLEMALPYMEQAAEASGRNFAAGPFVTVSTCSGTAEAGLELAERTGGVCENMEGAAVAQVCTLHGVSFLEIRGISNLVEDRDPSRWDLKKGAEMAQTALQAFLTRRPDGRSSA